jgi:protein tyrosine phosphatase (PTP) superfamily phosphohydrolase (DUF442 family)
MCMKVVRRIVTVVVTSLALVMLFDVARAADPAAPASQPTTRTALAPINDPRLHNAHRVTDKVIAGAQPDDEAAFVALKELGVKTIISVDGARPDVELAHKYGMRYVHLPMRYDGVEREQGLSLAKAINELPGRIYIHCHHGKHRSAAAVAVACVFNGELDASMAEAVLQTFGTGLNYKGLWKAAREATRIDDATIAATRVEFVETKKVPPLAEAMVAMDVTWDNLKLIQKAGWKPLASHPDLDADHEALQLEEHLHELIRTNAGKDHPEEFTTMMRKSEELAKKLKTALLATPVDEAGANAASKEIATSCTDCHKVYRD